MPAIAAVVTESPSEEITSWLVADSVPISWRTTAW